MIFRSFLTHHCTDIETIHFYNRGKGPTENSIWILYSWQLVFCDNSFNILHHHLFSRFTYFIDFLAAWCSGLVNFIFHKKPPQTSLTLFQCNTERHIKNVICGCGESWITVSITGQCNSTCPYTEYCIVLYLWVILKRKALCSCHDLKQSNSGLP